MIDNKERWNFINFDFINFNFGILLCVYDMYGQLNVPCIKTAFGDQIFTVNGPAVWNSLQLSNSNNNYK